MHPLLRKRWLWCLAVVLGVCFGLSPLVCFYADPYYRVRKGMTEGEVERLLGPAHAAGGTFESPDYATEIRYRSWDVLTIRYQNNRVVEKARAAHPIAELWQKVLYKVGWNTAPPPVRFPAVPLPGLILERAPFPESPDTETPAPAAPP
jgi:hypothetical protein